MSRDILQALDQAGIGLASATFEIVGLPPVRIDGVGKKDDDARSCKPEEC